MTKSLSST